METPIERIALVTDFGPGIYLGQMVGVLSALAPGLPVIDLVHDLPPFRPDLAAYLIPGLVRDMPRGTLYLCVVDPGVGGERAGILAEAGGACFVGPDNGLLSRVVSRAERLRVRRIDWRPSGMSETFHGRDWLAPVAARLARGQATDLVEVRTDSLVGADWPDERPTAVYVDGYGNVLCGMRAMLYPRDGVMRIRGRTLTRARTFCDAQPGQPFWYENALGLVEIAVNQGRADRVLMLAPGDPVSMPIAAPAAPLIAPPDLRP
jgi:hypothetical protein